MYNKNTHNDSKKGNNKRLSENYGHDQRNEIKDTRDRSHKRQLGPLDNGKQHRQPPSKHSRYDETSSLEHKQHYEQNLQIQFQPISDQIQKTIDDPTLKNFSILAQILFEFKKGQEASKNKPENKGLNNISVLLSELELCILFSELDLCLSHNPPLNSFESQETQKDLSPRVNQLAYLIYYVGWLAAHSSSKELKLNPQYLNCLLKHLLKK